jgi:predicted permease
MIRLLLKNWRLHSIAALSLAVAMALSVVALSVSNSLLLRAPFARDPGQLVTVYTTSRDNDQIGISYPDYLFIRDRNRSFAGVAAVNDGISKGDIHIDGRDELTIQNTVSANYFEVMGIRPAAGRLFAPDDDRRQVSAAVLSFACWQRWGADPRVVGKTVVVGRRPATIVGVAPKEFLTPMFGVGADLINNLGASTGVQSEELDNRSARRFLLAGRLKPGVTRAQARAELTALWGQLAAAYPEAERHRTVELRDTTVLPPDALSTARLLSAVLIAAALLILLIACANAANLLLALATMRRQGALIKTALGASRGRLVREFLQETVVLCAVSGTAGYLLALAPLHWLSRFDLTVPAYGSFPIAFDLHPGALVVVLTLGLIGLATVSSGLAPALYASKPNLASALSGEIAIGGTRRGVIRNAVVAVQVAVCTLVLVGTGLCLRSLHNLRAVDPGFAARNIAAVLIYPETLATTHEQGFQAYDEVRRRVERIPGVESVSLADSLPLEGGNGNHDEIHFTDRPPGPQKTIVDFAVADENYFSTMRIRLLAGRAFRASDREDSPDVVVINHHMAEMLWPHQEAIGRTFRIGKGKAPVTVVGVVADGKYSDLDEATRPYLYHPFRQDYRTGLFVIARTAGDPRLWLDPLFRAVRGAAMKAPMPPTTVDNWLHLALFLPMLTLACVSALAVLAVLLATVGLYGAISYSVSERRRELGIRIALGARPGQILQQVFRQTLWVSGAGVAAGLALGVAAGMVFRSQFFGVETMEWTVLAPVGMIMIALSLLIGFGAARRWTRMNPMDAVRHA